MAIDINKFKSGELKSPKPFGVTSVVRPKILGALSTTSAITAEEILKATGIEQKPAKLKQTLYQMFTDGVIEKRFVEGVQYYLLTADGVKKRDSYKAAAAPVVKK